MASAEPERRRGEVFDDVAEAYDVVRRGYAPGLVDAAVRRGSLTPGSPVVEVGCGTGKLTELLAARGLSVEAVDPGARMIEVARRRVGASSLVRFHLGRFEDVDLPASSFDAVLSATAFHWVDPTVGWRKAARLLRPGGLLALFTHRSVADEHTAAFDDGFRELWATYTQDRWPPPRDETTLLADAERQRANVSEVWDGLHDGRHRLAVPEAAELFGAAEVQTETEIVEETAEQGLALLRTTSTYLGIEADRRTAFDDDVRRLFERLGGTVRFPLLTLLVTATRADA
jgi:ubiquinone/menaquinone biosynthesis C-methylase UbiE